MIDYFGAIGAASSSGVTFGRNLRVTDKSFPAVFGVDPAINPRYMGDYNGVAADRNFFYVTWGDNRDASLAVPSRKNANVRLAKVPLVASLASTTTTFASALLQPQQLWVSGTILLGGRMAIVIAD